NMDIGGIEVDMPMRELRYGHIENIHEEVKEEDILKVKITNIDMDLDNKKLEISISAKKAQENPWDNIEKNIPLNSEKYGVVTGIDYDGAIVNLGAGIDAKAQHLKFQQPKKGDEVLVHVKNIDKKNEQIHCSIKRIQNKEEIRKEKRNGHKHKLKQVVHLLCRKIGKCLALIYPNKQIKMEWLLVQK